MRKGYIKCVNVQPNRISYLITPRGIAEKARLTYEFMDYSLHLYREVRQHLREVLQECAEPKRGGDLRPRRSGGTRLPVAQGIGPRAGGHLRLTSGGHEFLGMPVRPIAEHAQRGLRSDDRRFARQVRAAR